MKFVNFIKLVVPFIPALMSVCGAISMVYGLLNYFPKENLAKLDTVLTVLIFISVLLVAVLLGFILSKTAQLRFSGNSLSRDISKLTQQVHYFRDIADILLRSKVWAPGLKEYIDEEFAGLNYFQVKEFYKGRSKLAIEYMEQNNKYGETESLYLESKALLLNDPSKSRIDGYMNPKEYDLAILKKWQEHNVGMGWNHFFGFKYHQFKDELDVQRVFERHQDKILNYAVQLDTTRYQDMGFSEELISKLGAHLSEEVIPSLLSLTLQSVRRVPRIINLAYILLTLLSIFGIFQPIIVLLFGLVPIFSFTSIAVVLGIFLFVMLSVYPFVTSEINK